MNKRKIDKAIRQANLLGAQREVKQNTTICTYKRKHSK